jgi:hypothetical protein
VIIGALPKIGTQFLAERKQKILGSTDHSGQNFARINTVIDNVMFVFTVQSNGNKGYQ